MRRRMGLCALACAGIVVGGCATATNPPPSISVTVSPSSANVAVGKTQQFTATVTGTNNTAVTWSVAGGAAKGSIDPNGLYTAPGTIPSPPQVTITATSKASSSKSASATVTVTATSNVSVTVAPSSASMASFATQQFTAAVSGSSNTAVTWNVNGVTGGNQQLGFISSSGLYVAPGGVPTKSNGSGGSTTTSVTVNAVSQADSSASGSAIVTVLPDNQAAESGAIKLGTSGGNAKDSSTSGNTITCCGGTLGSLVSRGGTQFILSNTHVLARSDIATIGDPIIEPGLVDTGTCTASGARTVANLSAFYNLETGAAPKIDAAIAQVIPGNVDSAGNILYLGATADASGVPVPGAPHAGSGVVGSVGMAVAKSGRATGLTCSTLLSVNTSVNGVEYQKGCGTGATFTVNYTGQVVVAGGSFSAEGDSGSLIVTQNTADPVALLYGGSDMDTVGNPVAPVLSFFASGGNAVTFVGGGPHTVIGCSLPVKPASVSTTVSSGAVAPQALEKASAVRDAHSAELLANPEVQAVGLGGSFDAPNEPAILLFVTKDQARTGIPAQVDGVRTRIVEGDLFPKRGALSAQESKQLEQPAPSKDQVYAISSREMERAQVAHGAHADEEMRQRGVQGVGISSSLDAPGEAALMIFVIRGAAHDAIPAVVDGVRTRIRESSPFRAGVHARDSSTCSVQPRSQKKN